MTESRQKILAENEKVKNFIENWSLKNPYNPENLQDHNRKFKTDFKAFFETENFSESTKKIFEVL